MSSTEEKKEPISLKTCASPLPLTNRGAELKIDTNTNRWGTWIAYPSHNFAVLRSLENPAEMKLYIDHLKEVTVVRFSPNGEYCASGDAGGLVKVWDRRTMTLKNEFNACETIKDLAWSPDGKRIVAVGKGEPVGRCVSWDTSNKCGIIDGHSKICLSISMKPNRPYRFVTTCEDFRVNFSQGVPYKGLKGHAGLHTRYISAKYNKKGDMVVSVGQDSCIYLFDGKTGEKLKRVSKKAHGKSAIYSVSWSPDGKQFLTVGADRTAQIWDIEIGEREDSEGKKKPKYTVTSSKTYQFNKKGRSEMQMGCFWVKGKDTEYKGSISLDGSINFLGDDIGPRWQGHQDPITDFCMDRANGAFYTCGRGDEGRITRWEDGVGTWFAKSPPKGFMAIAVSCDGKTLYSAEVDNAIRSNEVKNMEIASDAVKFKKMVKKIATAKTIPDVYACYTTNDKLHVLNKSGLLETNSLESEPSYIEFNEDDTLIGVGCSNGDLALYAVDYKTGKCKLKRTHKKRHQKAILCVRFKGDFVSTSSDSSNIIVTKVADESNAVLNKRTKWSFATMSIKTHAWSPDGANVLSVSDDGSIIIYKDTKEFGEDKSQLVGAHRLKALYADWLDDGSFVTVGGDNRVSTWTYE